MVSPKVAEWGACELRYVAEAKLSRLDNDDLIELNRLLEMRLGRAPPPKPDAPSGVDREALIERLMAQKKELALKRKQEEQAAHEAAQEASGLIENVAECAAVAAKAQEETLQLCAKEVATRAIAEPESAAAMKGEAPHAPHEAPPPSR